VNDEQFLTLRRIVAWQVETAGSQESKYVAPLLDPAKDRGFAAETTAFDMGYDNERVYGEYEERDSRPIIPLRAGALVRGVRALHLENLFSRGNGCFAPSRFGALVGCAALTDADLYAKCVGGPSSVVGAAEMVEARLGPVHLATVDPHPPARTGLGLEAPAGGDGLSDGAATLAAARHPRDGWGLHLPILSLRDRATYGALHCPAPSGGNERIPL
jgi:hypothetical protein